MSSFRRKISSRANGALSAGPKTDAGKRRSSQNALRHGCRSRTFHCPESNLRPEFDQLQIDSISSLKPRTPRENSYVQQMVEARWRLRCVRERQAHLHAAFFASRPPGSFGDDPVFGPADAYLEILRLPGYRTLLDHEFTQQSKASRAFRNWLMERRKPAGQTNIEKPTNEPTLEFPYAPAKTPRTQNPVASTASRAAAIEKPANEPTLEFPYAPTQAPSSPPPRCRSRGSPTDHPNCSSPLALGKSADDVETSSRVDL